MLNILHGPVHEILVFVAYAHKPLLNVHTDVSLGIRGLNFGLSLHLYP